MTGEALTLFGPAPAPRRRSRGRQQTDVDRRRDARRQKEGRTWGQQLVTQPCGGCGGPVTRSRFAMLKNPLPVCRACRRDAQLTGQSSPLPLGVCPGCLRAFVNRRGVEHCSTGCRARCSGKASRVLYGDCIECGALWAWWKARRFCSEPCAVRAQRRRARQRERAQGRRNKGRVRRVAVVESFTLREIAERDGWRCHLCRKRVPDRPYKARPTDATLDHLVPVSDGGDHTRANVALAHNRCNYERRAAGVVQLRMVG